MKQILKEIAFQFFQIQNHQIHLTQLQFLHVQKVKNLMELVDVFLKVYKNHVQLVMLVMETETVFLFQFLLQIFHQVLQVHAHVNQRLMNYKKKLMH